MIQRFINYITGNNLFNKGETILAGVSGGIDSVVLLDLLNKAGYQVAIAHCNFRLRGKASNDDEMLVSDLARKYNTQIHSTSFDTLEYAHAHKISIEMAARELRYAWFEKIRIANNYACIAVAHHRDDQLETFFLNLARGTGLTGLTGMSPVNGKIVRPLLFASRIEIEQYRHANSLEFREDESNQSLDYQRNRIRHNLLPVMDKLNPGFREGMIKTMGYLDDVSKILDDSVKMKLEKVAIRQGNAVIFSIESLNSLNPLPAYLFEFLKPYGFNGTVVTELLTALGGTSGKQFISPTHRIVHDRDSLILTPLAQENTKMYYISEGIAEIKIPVHLRITEADISEQVKITDSKFVAFIDLDKVQFPLVLRKWKNGDYFKPLGMSGFKKISDFFIDLKLSLPEKENVWIIANGEQVIWIIGYRLDERFKITPFTQSILKIELVK